MGTRRIESFLLRIVVDDGVAQDGQGWRGRIQHIASGAELQIAELDQLVSFINTHLASLNAQAQTIPVVGQPHNADPL
jgi:hypothetical protein